VAVNVTSHIRNRLPIETTATAWFSINTVMFRIEAYVSITWYCEAEQVVLLTELQSRRHGDFGGLSFPN